MAGAPAPPPPAAALAPPPGAELPFRLGQLLGSADYRCCDGRRQRGGGDLRAGFAALGARASTCSRHSAAPTAHPCRRDWEPSDRCQLLRLLCMLCAESAGVHDTLHGEEDEVR